MDTVATRKPNVSRVASAVAALVAALVAASAVHAAGPSARQRSPDGPTPGSRLAVVEARSLASAATASAVK